jgi:hypothetical protein
LDLGNIALNSTGSLKLKLDNFVTGPADDLSSGVFSFIDGNDFTFSGWNSLAMLQAGDASGELGIGFLASALGGFQDTIDFNGFSTNASDPTGIAEQRTLIIKANVTDGSNSVPEPGTLALLLIAIAGALVARRRGLTLH